MTNLNDDLGWVNVVRIEADDLALGGNETNQPNKVLKELASRDRYLRNLISPDATAQATFEEFKQIGISAVAQGRLTTESGVPISSGDRLAQTTLYYTPYIGDHVAIYDTANTRWELRQFTEVSLNLSGLATNTNYDIFAYWDGDSVEMQAVAWTSGSNRNQPISQLNGIWIKSSDSRRLLGTMRTVSAGQTEISAKKILVSNLNNKIRRVMLNRMTTVGDYTYTTAAWRRAYGVGDYNLQIVTPLDTFMRVDGALIVSGNVRRQAVGIGFDSQSVNSAQIYSNSLAGDDDSGGLVRLSRHLITAYAALEIPAGYHYVQLLEWGQAAIANFPDAVFTGSFEGDPAYATFEDMGHSGIIAEWNF